MVRLPLLGYVAAIALRAQSPGPILDTSNQNPPYHSKAGNWGASVCGGRQYFKNEYPPDEWMQVLHPGSKADDDPVVAAGVVVSPSLSENDVPFTHPFGLDWQFSIALDPRFDALLALGNAGPDAEFVEATRRAAVLGLPAKKGVLGVETDQDLIPAAYRAREGDRVVVMGRWIADCGHTDFHAEIHPPLLMVTARAAGSTATKVSLISRPWLVGQRFQPDDEPIRRHLLNEVIKVETFRSTRVEAHPRILPPFSRPVRMDFTVRPPLRRSPNDRLAISFHFTVRRGVTVAVARAGADAVAVRIDLDPAAYKVAPLPRRKDWYLPIAFIGRRTDVIDKIQLANLIGHPLAGLLLQRDWITDRYDAPVAAGTHDFETSAAPYSIDDSQPFPIYGWMRVEWTHR
jgi:hypothetical protein